MCRRPLRWLTVALCAAVAGPPSAWATIDNFKSFKEAYPGKEPKAYSCKVCHQGAIGKKGDLNAYGAALSQLKAPANPKKLTVEAYRAVESQDADGDGTSNGQELKAGTNPADASSVPPAPDLAVPAAAPATKPTKSEKSTAPADATAPGSSSRLPDDVERVEASLAALISPLAWAEEPSDQSTESSTESGSSAPARAEYVGPEACAACHVKETQEFKHSTHARISIPGDNVKAQGCEMCHGPGSLHVAAGGGRGVGGIINPRKDPSTCFECHTDKKAEFRLPYHHPVLEGKMSCADCHSPHGTDIRPWSATTLKDINEACFTCHKDQRGPFVWEHEAVREGCTTCHKVHGSIHDKMLIARDTNLCLRCHTQANFPVIGKSSHGGRLPQGTCFSAGCHTAVHGSNFDDHLRY